MSSRPFTVDPNETLERAALFMLDRKNSGVPVVTLGRVVGIVTESDLFRALVKLLGFESRGARLAFEFGARRDVLQELSRRLSKARLLGLVSYLDIPSAKQRVVARVAARR
jgi:acetoin utilization protein AcuB